MNNFDFGKNMGNVRKHRDIKLVKTNKERNQLVSEPHYHAVKGFSENLVASLVINIKAEDFYEDIADMMLKKDLIHQIMNAIDHYLQEKIKK